MFSLCLGHQCIRAFAIWYPPLPLIRTAAAAAHHRAFYMPLWSGRELQLCRRSVAAYSGLSEQLVEELFWIAGGVARTIFKEALVNNLTPEELVKQLIQKVQTLSSSQLEVRHTVMHFQSQVVRVHQCLLNKMGCAGEMTIIGSLYQQVHTVQAIHAT